MSILPALFAKGRAANGALPPTIAEHCHDVLEMAEVIWDQLEEFLCDATALPVESLRARVRPLLLVAAVLHDFMKANSAFQQLLTKNSDRRTQPIRHEILAAIQLSQNHSLREWLRNALSEDQLWSLIWAIGGHHFQMRLKREHEPDDPMFRSRNIPKRVMLHLGHPQVEELIETARSVLANCGRDFDPGPAPRLADSAPLDPLDDAPEGLEQSVHRLIRESNRAWKSWLRDPESQERRQTLALLKLLLIAADIAGSALPRSKEISVSPANWIEESLGRTLNTEDLQRIVNANLNGRPARAFQSSVSNSECPVTVVTAGCGNGKTTAAYMWGQKWAVGRKLFFTYPTTGTASAGFRDYLFAQTELERTLIHGRAGFDLQTMWESSDIPPIERTQRLESLNAWGQQLIACTVDTVLGLIQNQRRSVFSFPAIVRGAFVFDEVHSYDRRLFAELLRFLEVFPGVPVLIMSASIPPERLEHLQRVCGDRMNREPIRGDQTMERVPRYQLHEADEDRCWHEADLFLRENDGDNAHKVLWVCNTVDSAVQVYRQAREQFPFAEVLLYHSRYRYGDRIRLQESIIDEFQYADSGRTAREHRRPAIAVTTQVCEMSLDISADLLVSAMCPLPSLVQRLGRLNRYAMTDDPKPAYIFPFEGRPYHEHDAPAHLTASVEMIRQLAGEPCSQAKLGQYIDRLQSNEVLPEYSAWLDGGWQSEPLPARDGDNSITLVREEDLQGLARGPNGQFDRDQIVPLSISMLFRRGFDWSQRAAGFPIAPAGTVLYDWNENEQRGKGASWARKP